MSDTGPVRGGLAAICEYPQNFGCLLILPEPKATAPWGEFSVTSARLDPERRFGTLRFSRRREDGWDYGPAQVLPGDCLIHVPTGTTAAVVHRDGNCQVTVEGWTEPRTEAGRVKWLRAPGVGKWVVWGSFFRRLEDIPPHARPAEVVEGEDAEAARRDLFRHPERLPWSQMGFKVARHPREFRGKARKKLRRQLRALLGGVHTAQGLGDAEEVRKIMDRYANWQRKFKSGGRFIDWNLPAADK